MHEIGSQGSKHHSFGNLFYLENTRKLRFHVFLYFCARYLFCFFFFWSGPNSLNFIPIWFGPYNWNNISNFLWIPSIISYMFSSMKMAEYIESELSGIFLVYWSSGTQPIWRCLCSMMSLSEKSRNVVNQTVTLKSVFLVT